MICGLKSVQFIDLHQPPHRDAQRKISAAVRGRMNALGRRFLADKVIKNRGLSVPGFSSFRFLLCYSCALINYDTCDKHYYR